MATVVLVDLKYQLLFEEDPKKIEQIKDKIRFLTEVEEK